MKDITFKIDNKVVSNNKDIRYNDRVEENMSKLLMTKAQEEVAQGLLTILKGAENQPHETVEIKKSSVRELVGLVELLLTKKPITLDEDLTTTEAGEIAGVSRPLIMNLIKTGKLKGYPVGSHWRVTRESILKYIADRENFMEDMAKMDEAGFGID